MARASWRGLSFFYPHLLYVPVGFPKVLCELREAISLDGLRDKLRQIPRLPPRSVCVSLPLDDSLELMLRVGSGLVPLGRRYLRAEVLLRLLL